MRFFFFMLSSLLALSCHKAAASEGKPSGEFISFQSHGCRGYCPVYTLSFRNNGKARYEGIRNTVKAGVTEFTLTKAELKKLKTAVTACNVWQYPDNIASNLMDAPGGTITVYKKDAKKSVSGTVDRPKPLLELEALMQSLAKAHGIDVTTGVDPREIPANSRSEVIVKLKDDLNAGNWIARFSEIKLRLVRRLGAQNIWLVAFNPAQISEKALLEMLKSTEGVLEAQPNRKTEERN